MKVLLSAFACEPNKGSEFSVGWNWAVSLARAGHQVVALTRSESRAAIDKVTPEMPAGLSLKFEYFDVPKPFRWQMRGPLHLHSALWQWQAANHADQLNRTEKFDCVHHVTYAGLRAPSFMGKLGIPFILGPVGGGERAPWRLRQGYSLGGQVYDASRDAANLVIRFIPIMRGTFASADRIYVTSRETLRLMPRRFHDKATIELAIGAEESAPRSPAPVVRQAKSDQGLRLLHAGRFVDYKGMHLGIPAFARLVKACPAARLTMVGEGPAKRRWQQLAIALGVASNVDWLPWQAREQMARLYADHDVLLFPAMHDSGGMVVLEAMDNGLPVVCLKLGGPATLVNASCGYAVDPAGKSPAEVVTDMGDALIRLVQPSDRAALSAGARRRCHDFSWAEKVGRIYGCAA